MQKSNLITINGNLLERYLKVIVGQAVDKISRWVDTCIADGKNGFFIERPAECKFERCNKLLKECFHRNLKEHGLSFVKVI